jgi:hypothetical protein
MKPGRYIFCVDDPTDTERYINYFYTDREFTSLNSTIRSSSPPSIEQEIAESLITSLRMPQNKSKDSFCSKNKEGVSEEYIIDKFISKKDASGTRKILINTIIYFDTNNAPYGFLMYKNYPGDSNSMYISILCINSLQPKSEYSAIVYGDQIVNNFKVACETVGIHNIYLESIPSAEKFWKNQGFKLVDPQPIYSSSSGSSSSSSSSSGKSSRSSKSRSSRSSRSSSKSSSKSSSSRSSSSSSHDKLFYFNIIPGSRAKGNKRKGRYKNKTKRNKTLKLN